MPVIASMEPWFGNHGNCRDVAPHPRDRRASMEPWFGNHGNGGDPGPCRSRDGSFNGAVVR